MQKLTAPSRTLQNLRDPHSAEENLTDLEILVSALHGTPHIF